MHVLLILLIKRTHDVQAAQQFGFALLDAILHAILFVLLKARERAVAVFTLLDAAREIVGDFLPLGIVAADGFELVEILVDFIGGPARMFHGALRGAEFHPTGRVGIEQNFLQLLRCEQPDFGRRAHLRSDDAAGSAHRVGRAILELCGEFEFVLPAPDGGGVDADDAGGVRVGSSGDEQFDGLELSGSEHGEFPPQWALFERIQPERSVVNINMCNRLRVSRNMRCRFGL